MKQAKLYNLIFVAVWFCASVNAQQENPSLFPVRVNGLTGYIDNTGQMIIEPKPEPPLVFSDDLALVNIGNERYGYINRNRELVIEPQFEAAAPFSEGLASVLINDKWGYIDKTGRVVIAPKFLFADKFSEGLASVTSGKGYGFINTKGEYVIAPRFDYAETFSDGLAAVRTRSNKVGFINKQGQLVIAPRFDSPGNPFTFAEGLAPVGLVRNLKSPNRPLGITLVAGYIDRSGKLVIAPRFDSAARFSEGLALVKSKGGWQYIDKTGKTVIALDKDVIKAGNFINGLVLVETTDGKSGYINQKGKYVWKPTR